MFIVFGTNAYYNINKSNKNENNVMVNSIVVIIIIDAKSVLSHRSVLPVLRRWIILFYFRSLYNIMESECNTIRVHNDTDSTVISLFTFIRRRWKTAVAALSGKFLQIWKIIIIYYIKV